MAREVRYRTFNRVDKAKSLRDMKRLGLAQYNKFAAAERKSKQKEGYTGAAIRDGPIQRLGAEGYWLIISEMKRDPQLKGPDGIDFVAGNSWAQTFVKHIAELNESIGEAKFQQLIDAMDFMRCLFGKPGQYGCIVVYYLCSHCKSCPKFDYHWCVIYGSKTHWSCCKCGGLYRPGDPTAFLFGIQIGHNPATDIVWYVAHPPFGADQDLMNLIKSINALMTGVLLPERFEKACTAEGVASFSEEIKAMLTTVVADSWARSRIVASSLSRSH